MDWARAVDINRVALTRIVAEIFALLRLVGSGGLDRLPQALYVAAERLLRPTESALRRLIVIAARGLVVKPLANRPMPKGLVIVSKSSSTMSFRLFDKRTTFDFITSENPLFVRVKTTQNNPFNLFNQLVQSRPPEQTSTINVTRLSRRLAAVAHALETLPRQAQRLARWKARRKTIENPKFTSPLRPGPPPSLRNKLRTEVDFVLQECHALAFDALREDSS